MDKVNINDLEILTDDGFKDFSGIRRSKTNRLVNIALSNGKSLNCTPDHLVYSNDRNRFVESKDLQHGEVLSKDSIVSNVELIEREEYVYDALNVKDTSSYFTEGIISHNCAHIEGWEEFSTSVLPTISSGKTTKMIVVSTPCGLNHFYQMVDGAKKGRNSYVLHEVTWRDVPGRDEKWKRETLELMNWNYEKFAQEQENEFLGSSGTLISGAVLKELEWKEPATKSADGISIYEQPEKNHNYVLTVDVARGKGIDYSAIQVTDITNMPYRQVATFHSNLVTPADLTSYIFMLGKKYNEGTVLIEVNDIGAQVSEMLFYDYEYENVLMTENAGRQGKRISGGGGKNVDIGIRMTKTVKAIGCSILKMLVEQGQYVVQDWNTIHELSVFSAKGQSYEAEPGEHDDLVDPLLLFAWLSDQAYFKDLTDINTLHNLRDSLPNSDAVDMNDLPDMVMVDGVDHNADAPSGDEFMDGFF